MHEVSQFKDSSWGSTLAVLYAEDDENDAFLMQRAFRQADVGNPLRVVEDGRLALQYLAGEGVYADRLQHPAACLVLLDLKMPGQSGFDVLKWARAQLTTATLPMVVLTSSSHDTDIQRAYLLGANGYLIKPGRPDQLLSVVKSIRDFWLFHNRTLPIDPQSRGQSKGR